MDSGFVTGGGLTIRSSRDRFAARLKWWGVPSRQAAQRSVLTQALAPNPSSFYTRPMSQTRPDFLSLSVAERIQLAEDIWDSIATESPESAALTPLQLQELQARLDSHDQDPSTAVSWDQVRTELFQRSH